MGTILVTGFEPFGGLERNPSGEVARAVAGQGVEAVVLPVEDARIGPTLRELCTREWSAVLLLGLAVGRSKLSLERVAINYRDPRRPDNTGTAPQATCLDPGGPDAYFSSLPLERLRERLAAAGLPVEISLSAGAYLCNAAFYLARRSLDARRTPCGFLHLPPTPDLACGAEPLAFERQLRGVEIVVEELRRNPSVT